MSILNAIVSYFVKSKIDRITYFGKHPEEVQNRVFHQLLEGGKGTLFGRKYGLDEIKTIIEFQQKLPVSTYEDLFPYINKMLQGKSNMLWNKPVKWFSKSSGTTNDRSKYIPLPEECLEEVHYKGGKDLIAIYLHNNPESNFYLGKGLALGGSLQSSEKGINTGDVSAVIMQNLPAWAQLMRSPDLKTALHENYEEKLAQIIQKTTKRNVTNFSGVPTWTYVLIQKVLEETGKNNILEVWPNLEWYAHGGVSFEPYRDLFKKLIPSDNMHYTEIYNASEGFFAIQDKQDSTDLLLMLDYGIFYEFIPVEKIDEENPPVITINEVELEKNYALVITVIGGLWRYLIGDTVKFTSLKPYRIKITGRTKHFINAFGEELMIENAEKGLKYACSKTGANIKDYTAAPVYFGEKGKGCHEWVIEFENPPEDIEQFSAFLDNKLREVNSDYDAKRHQELALGKLQITVAPLGTFYKWLEGKNKLGGQNKVPRLKNDRYLIEEIKSLI